MSGQNAAKKTRECGGKGTHTVTKPTSVECMANLEIGTKNAPETSKRDLLPRPADKSRTTKHGDANARRACALRREPRHTMVKSLVSATGHKL